MIIAIYRRKMTDVQRTSVSKGLISNCCKCENDSKNNRWFGQPRPAAKKMVERQMNALSDRLPVATSRRWYLDLV